MGSRSPSSFTCRGYFNLPCSLITRERSYGRKSGSSAFEGDKNKVKNEGRDHERRKSLQWFMMTFQANENQGNASEYQKVDRQLLRRIANTGTGYFLSVA